MCHAAAGETASYPRINTARKLEDQYRLSECQDTHEQEQSAYEQNCMNRTIQYKKMLRQSGRLSDTGAECVVLGNLQMK